MSVIVGLNGLQQYWQAALQKPIDHFPVIEHRHRSVLCIAEAGFAYAKGLEDRRRNIAGCVWTRYGIGCSLVGGSNDLSRLHAATSEEQRTGSSPMVTSATWVDLGSPAEFAQTDDQRRVQ